jgi:uncharacterized membrane protein YbjE (DUF340 family)
MLNVDLLTVVIPFVAGVALGYFLRKRRKLSLNKATFWIIIILIFSLGFSMGSNNKLLISFPHVGLRTIVMLFLTLFFSVIFVKIARKVVNLQ